MFNTILILVASLINVVGTAYAVLSILRITLKEVFSSITLHGMDERDKELLVQRKQARIGIALVLYAWIVQFVFSFVSLNSWNEFLWALLIVIAILIIILIILFLINKRFESNYRSYKEGQKANPTQDSPHIDSHMWGKF